MPTSLGHQHSVGCEMRTFSLVPGFVYAESFKALETDLYRCEERYLQGKTLHRRREFTTVRALAARCFERFGMERPPLLATSHRGPLWPAGVRGSLSHVADHYAASLIAGSLARGIGVDVERRSNISQPTLRSVMTLEEWPNIEKLGRLEPGLPWSSLHFSAKEAVFKALSETDFPATQLRDIVVRLDRDGSFQGRSLASRWSAADTMRTVGWWGVRSTSVITLAISFPPRSCSLSQSVASSRGSVYLGRGVAVRTVRATLR